ncbi:MAG TPA: zinc-dependent alcohol dehydrogenase family protein [Dyella sp.]|uniref:zinc-dependent alcohol dehydrogenase family protein n=1 Tax=Dyella sp. TaxID=1869338 RepID=UPI002D798C09|nr:zinc-dependent alcohol dehydrogenase family protein [Dyella sp.]HET6553079.1 zinc-dependent alcohol dehydrogenase family protein [Dyella sp.]
MDVMRLMKPGHPLVLMQEPTPVPGPGQVRIKVLACGVCRTDLHVYDGELPQAQYPVVPGHEIVGVVDDVGDGVLSPMVGDQVGVPWLGRACGYCFYCTSGSENLCDSPIFTGCTRDGGYATQVIADARYCLPLPVSDYPDPAEAAPLLCAGLIGGRTLKLAGECTRVGMYGFGAAAHLLIQVATSQGKEVYAFTREGDVAAQQFAQSLGATWAGSSALPPPCLLDAALIFAPAGELIPMALRAVRKGGSVVCGGIHMSDIPSFPYDLLWGERRLLSVANLTREDGRVFLAAAAEAKVKVHVERYRLEQANEALDDLRLGILQGAAVLIP